MRLVEAGLNPDSMLPDPWIKICVFLVFENLATPAMVEPCLLESKARSSLLTYAAVGDGSSPHFDLATWTAGGGKS